MTASACVASAGVDRRARILIVGSSGHARVAIDVAERMDRFVILGLIDGYRAPGESTFGYLVLGGEDDIPTVVRQMGVDACFVAIGDNTARARVSARIAELCPELAHAVLIHPSAVIGREVVVGRGTVVMAGAVINPCCVVGEGCIVNTNATLDHDCRMEAFASIAPGVSVGGSCRIGASSAVGIGAVVTHARTIGADTVVGAGATVLSDLPANCVAYGTPAAPVRARAPGERYL